MTRACRRRGGFAVLVAAAAIGLAACSSGSSTPQVASAGTSSSKGSGNSVASGNGSSAGSGTATQSLDEWASCMRSHGDPGQPDPTIDANKIIHIVIPAGAPKDTMGSPGAQTCNSYLTSASKALGPGLNQRVTPAELLKFSQCMRANGIADFPDPSGSGLSLNRGSGSSDLNPNSPAFQNASKVCARQTGVQTPASGTAPAGTIEVVTSAMAGANG